MTQRFTLLTLLSLLVFGACKKKEAAPQDWQFSISVSKTILDGRGQGTFGGYEEGIEVSLYNGYANFINNQPLATTTSALNSSGSSVADFKIPFKNITNIDSLYFRAKKGNLNSIRSHATGKLNLGSNPTQSGGIRTASMFISTTPTKLRLQILDAGQKVQGAFVSLYTSESLYNTNSSAQAVIPTNQATDANGEVEYTNLEPRQYWFRVEKTPKTNNATTFKTSTALPDDANITNVIQVGIQ